MGNRRLGVVAQAQGELQDIGGQLFYQNLGSRLNWSLVAGRSPYRSGRRGVEDVVVDGNQALLLREQVFRTFVSQVGGGVAYPFSRARRIEANASFTHYGFGAEENRFLCNVTGQSCQQVGESDLEGLARNPLNLFQTSAAYVGDWSNFAFTGPVSGGRCRFAVEPTFGDLQFTSALADYRRYIFLRPLTVAVRGLHYGRYGPDSENREFLTPLFLGSEDMVRGYGVSSFRSTECSGMNGGTGCPEFDRLIGSRIGVGSVELRFPLFGSEDFGLVSFPYLPITIGAFFDVGVAWTADESPDLEFVTSSTGTANQRGGADGATAFRRAAGATHPGPRGILQGGVRRDLEPVPCQPTPGLRSRIRRAPRIQPGRAGCPGVHATQARRTGRRGRGPVGLRGGDRVRGSWTHPPDPARQDPVGATHRRLLNLTGRRPQFGRGGAR